MLFNQFKYFFNLYFLLLACSQFVNELRLGALYTYWVPLVSQNTVLLWYIGLILMFTESNCNKFFCFFPSGVRFDYYDREGSRWGGAMFPTRQRGQFTDLQQTLHKRWAIVSLFVPMSFYVDFLDGLWLDDIEWSWFLMQRFVSKMCVVNVVKWAISWRELFAGFVRSSFIVWCRFECELLIPYARICYVNVLQ